MSDLHRVISRSVHGDKIPDSLVILLDVGRESKLQHEIRDIIDELDMMINVARQQDETITRFTHIAEQILTPKEEDNAIHSDQRSQPDVASDKELEKIKLKAFQKRAADIRSDMSRRMKELEGLKTSAKSTAQNVRVLICIILHIKRALTWY